MNNACSSSYLGPGLICVGMPKCGTSTLHHFLEKREEFFLPPVKEIKFFSYNDHKYSGSFYALVFSKNWMAYQERRAIHGSIREVLKTRDLSEASWIARFSLGRRDERWYQSLFPSDRIGVDISPVYSQLSAEQIADVRRVAPDARIIILLRSPLQQLWSHCRMVVTRRHGLEDAESFRNHLAEQIAVRRSYLGLVEDWRAAFPDRVLVRQMREMIEMPDAFLSKILAFMELEDHSPPSTIQVVRANAGQPLDVPASLRRHLADAARIRLEGFDTIEPDWEMEWRAEIERFENGELTL